MRMHKLGLGRSQIQHARALGVQDLSKKGKWVELFFKIGLEYRLVLNVVAAKSSVIHTRR